MGTDPLYETDGGVQMELLQVDAGHTWERKALAAGDQQGAAQRRDQRANLGSVMGVVGENQRALSIQERSVVRLQRRQIARQVSVRGEGADNCLHNLLRR